MLVPLQVVAPPAPPTFGPVFFDVHMRNNLLGFEWVVERRYSAFDALKNELWWKRVALAVKPELLPPKTPPPGYDLEMLRERATQLEVWASLLIQQNDALRMPSVMAFFARASPRGPNARHHPTTPLALRPHRSSARHSRGLAVDPPRNADGLEDELREAEAAIVRLQAASRGHAARNAKSGEDFGTSPRGKGAVTHKSSRGLVFMLIASLLLPVALGFGLQAYPDAAPSLAASVAPYTTPSYTYLSARIQSWQEAPAPPPPPPPPPRKNALRAIVRGVKRFLKALGRALKAKGAHKAAAKSPERRDSRRSIVA